ncbi:hypothetical protein LSAT2_020541 [Lamellibrachia satsuma]|nr:hypothetical protein LSAT2_020541 [Lamellibrachia satsuma]
MLADDCGKYQCRGDDRIEQLRELARSGFWGVSKPKKQWALDVMRLLRDYDDPKLWHHVSTNFVYDGKMDLSCALTADALTDLDYLLRSGEARDVTSLK